MTCQLHWIGITNWWCQIDSGGQAAWVQGIGSIVAIGIAIFIPYWQRRNEKAERETQDRKIVMSTAANLDIALNYEEAVFDFKPAGDGVIGHDFTLEQAREFMKLRPQTQEALKNAIDKCHYFSELLCEKVVHLGIKAAAYERIIDEMARRTDNTNPDDFFRKVKSTNESLAEQIKEVRELLKTYLPKQA